MAHPQPIRTKTKAGATDVLIPDKLYFRIGDAARVCGLPAYVLRFWETEFPQLKPHKGGTGQRLYRKRDIELILEIKRLLYAEGFTIAGARRFLADKRRDPDKLAADVETAPPRAASDPRELLSAPRAGKREPASRPSSGASGKPPLDVLRVEMKALLDMLSAGQTARSREAMRPRRSSRKDDAKLNSPGLFEN